MARTKGSRNKYPSKRLVNKGRMPTITMEEQFDQKHKIIQLLCDGTAQTISDAARQCGLKPVNVWHWGRTDPDFKDALYAAQEVLADTLERKLTDSHNFIPWMFLLKKIRPEYKDNYRFDGTSSKMQEILEELSKLSKEPKQLPAPNIIEGQFVGISPIKEVVDGR